MIWQEEMKRDAVRVAFPEWSLDDADSIHLNAVYTEEYYFDEYDSDVESLSIVVTVNGKSGHKSKSFEKVKAASFFTALMDRTNPEEITALQAMVRISEAEVLRKHRRELADARQTYETAMYYASINDETRAVIHGLAQNGRGGRPQW